MEKKSQELLKFYTDIYELSKGYILRVDPHVTFDRLLPETVEPYTFFRTRNALFDKEDHPLAFVTTLITAYREGFPHLANDIDFWHINLWTVEYIIWEQLPSFDPIQCLETMVKKREDYGDLPLRISGTVGVMARSGDKLCRYYNLVQRKPNETNFESIADTLHDYFNYCLIALELINKKSCAG